MHVAQCPLRSTHIANSTRAVCVCVCVRVRVCMCARVCVHECVDLGAGEYDGMSHVYIMISESVECVFSNSWYACTPVGQFKYTVIKGVARPRG